MKDYITVIGGGLAGSEAAYQIAKKGLKVKLFEMRPTKTTPAHSTDKLAEIVCSNSFKSNLITNACGLLKEELRRLDSLLIKIADETQVPSGQALAVDREKFSKRVTEEIENNPLIEIVRKEVRYSSNYKIEKENNYTYEMEHYINNAEQNNENIEYFEDLINDGIVIIATGPLTSDNLYNGIEELIGKEFMHFYDASAPIVEKDSINFDIAFYGNRYEEERKKDENVEKWKERIKTVSDTSYINIPMNKEEYEVFYNELINAERVELHSFEKREIFEGCMPIEVMASRGIDTIRFGPLKPVGFTDPRTGKRPYAVIQLRQDDANATIYNMVGFQTNLKIGEQKRVFRQIKGLENAEFVRYGVMHRNTFINSSNILDNTYNLKSNKNIFFAGQITGVEGYVESIASGLVAGINAVNKLQNISKLHNKDLNKKDEQIMIKDKIAFDETTMIGALAKYISTPNKDFQPMNANFGILPELEEKIRDKKQRYTKLAERAITKLEQNTRI